MYLKSLEIGGFKSFAKKEELEFATPITAIVGPNGSGKSNVAESFRFVLGEQSIKSMRGKKGEDLIWGGSSSVPRQNRASVKVVLDNEKRVFPVDYNEIVVERVVHRDGTNEYMINGSRTRLKDVHELLAGANIGPSGHHIISQGEADRVLSATPKERREMIEDALGLKVYQYKKAESERKLARAQENMAHVESLRKEVQPHLRFLEKQVKKIEKALALKEELFNTYQEYLKREDTYITHHTTRLHNARRDPQVQLAQLADERTRAKAALENEKDDEKQQELVELEGELQQVRTRRQEAGRETGRIEGQMSTLERLLAQRKSKTEDAPTTVALADVEAAFQEVRERSEGAEHETDVSRLREVVRDMCASLEAFIHKARPVSPVSDTAEEEEELATLKKEKETHDAHVQKIEEEEARLRERTRTLRASIEEEEGRGREAERELFRIMEAEREVEQKLQEIDHELSMLKRDTEDFQEELREAVVLIGRGASEYMEYSIRDGEREVTSEDMLAEDRTVQRERHRVLEKMKVKLEELGSGANDEIMKEYTEVKERDEFLEQELRDLELSVEKLEGIIDDLTRELNEQFIAGITEISTEFNRLFVLMFGGGAASLERVAPQPRKKKSDMDDLLGEPAGDQETEDEYVEEGIEIDVKLPNKRVKGLEMLSGGERALTSIALIFAMSQINPPLFIILDETDAALDEANSRRYGDMIESLSKKSQLILITHNRETMSRAGVLYGVTMGNDGVSKLLSVKLDEAVSVAK